MFSLCLCWQKKVAFGVFSWNELKAKTRSMRCELLENTPISHINSRIITEWVYLKNFRLEIAPYFSQLMRRLIVWWLWEIGLVRGIRRVVLIFKSIFLSFICVALPLSEFFGFFFFANNCKFASRVFLFCKNFKSLFDYMLRGSLFKSFRKFVISAFSINPCQFQFC